MSRKNISHLVLEIISSGTIIAFAILVCVATALLNTHANTFAHAPYLHPAAAQPAAGPTNPCPRFTPGSVVTQPVDLFSQRGVLSVDLIYRTAVDPSIPVDQAPNPLPPPFATGLQQFCFTTPDGQEQPTLHVWPGDHLIIKVKNDAPNSLVFEPDGTIDYNQPAGTDNTLMAGMPVDSPCLAAISTAASTNIHFHGLNVAPTCGQDDTLHTIINSGQTFTYDVPIPANEPPGLYWYHPHIHGMNEGVVQGGASGAIVVEGIQNIQPDVAGLPEQTLLIRDQPVPGNPLPVIGSEIPSWDLTLNYVTISSCQDPQPCASTQFVGDFKPAVIQMRPGEKQFWRVVNSAAHTAMDLQLLYDGKPQPLQLVALDGVPVNSQDGTGEGHTFTKTDIPLDPASRAEFIITGPSRSVKNAVFETLRVPTGPQGDNHPTRPLAIIKASPFAPEPPLTIPRVSSGPWQQLFADLASAKPTAHRKLYFSEVLSDPSVPTSPTNFFITVDGQTPKAFDPNNPPAITTTQGSVEDWTIQNRAQENHAFHIHQIHFLLLERNGVPVPPDQQQYLDTVDLPFWTGTGPYPSVKVRMDFRGAVVGDFVFHCHFIFHSDFGMMAIIRVLSSRDSASSPKPTSPHRDPVSKGSSRPLSASVKAESGGMSGMQGMTMTDVKGSGFK